MGGDRGKMSSFPDPIELGELDGQWDEEDPSIFDRKTAVPGEVPEAPTAPPDGTAGSDDQISGLHQRQTPEDGPPSFREPLPDDLPPVLGRPPESTRARVKSKKPSAPAHPKPTEPSPKRDESWRSTGARPKRPALELELEDIESKAPAPPKPRPDALEAPVPERSRPTMPERPEPVFELRASEPVPDRSRITRPIQPPEPQPFFEPLRDEPPLPVSQPQISPEVLDMRDRYATGDFTGALVIAESLLEVNPEHEEARRCHGRCTDVLSQMYFARLGSPAQSVRVAVPNDQIKWLSLDHRAGFLLSLVDGHLTVEELLDISGMGRLDALRILYGLLDQRVIALCERS